MLWEYSPQAETCGAAGCSDSQETLAAGLLDRTNFPI